MNDNVWNVCVYNFAAKPKGVPEDYLEIDDPSLQDDQLESEMDLSSPNPVL